MNLLSVDMPTANIPIIDISAQDVSQQDIARQLVNAAEEHGFIYIRNMGNDIPAADIDGAFEIVSFYPHLCDLNHYFE